MTDELVEIAARALVPVASGTQEDMYGRDLPDKQFDDLTPDWQEAFRRYARAVLAAVTTQIEARVTGEIVAWLRKDDFAATADALARGDYKESQP